MKENEIVPTNHVPQQTDEDAQIISEAKKRFDRCAEWEASARERFIDDVKFENGDSDNGYQWPNAIRRNRDVDNRPCLTMNLIRQHNLQISNEARKNKSSMGVVPLGGGATVDSANAMRDIIRHIELRSGAQNIYTTARSFQIGGGIGWWRIVTDYVSNDSMDQEILLRPVNDPLAVYLDPDIKQLDGSDARFGFYFDEVPLDLWEENYPDFADVIGHQPLSVGAADDDWVSRNHIRVCEYFRKVRKNDELISFVWQGERKNIRRSQLPPNIPARVLTDNPLTKSRPIVAEEIEWFLIAGSQIIDRTVWIGKYIPFVRAIGQELVIEGILDRKGHTRAMKDPQRMLNYNASSQVEFVALQGKTPWIAPAKAIEEYESMWNTANQANHSVLVWNHIDDEGNEIAPPQRTQPVTASPAYQAGMETAFNQMMMVSGQWQNQMGMMGNERTGKAIALRQSQSDTAVFHFQDNYESALMFSAQQIIDLVPKIYDTKRVLAIIAEDGETYELQIDPTAQKAYQEANADALAGAKRIVLNPQMGLYDVAPSVGPAYGSKSQETADSLTLILTQAPTLTPVLADLLVGSLPFDKAKEAAQRLRRLVPPMALGQGPTPQEAALGQTAKSLQDALAEALRKNAKQDIKLQSKDQLRDTDVYQAETDRINALKDYLPAEPDLLRALVSDLVKDALATDLGSIIAANADERERATASRFAPAAAGRSPVTTGNSMPPGAKQAKDGEWYIEDETRPGKYYRLRRKGQPNGK